MDPKPHFFPRQTSDTVHERELSELETKGGSPEPLHKAADSPPESEGEGEGLPSQSAPAPLPTVNRRIYDVSLLTGITVMLSWPWIFWGVVFRMQGIQMSDLLARVVIDHPPYVSFFVTLVGNVVALVVDVLFSLSVVRFAQEWMAVTDEVTVFQVSVLSAFRYQSWPWLFKDLKAVFGRKRWLPVVLVGVCIAAFAFVPSSTTTLLAPVPFNKTVVLVGTELDFSSTTSECVRFLDANSPSNNCDWQVISGVPITSCLDQTQLLDVLESIRVNMLLLLPNTSESFTLTQFGNKPGLRFIGPSRGILPIGPNSPIPTLDTLQHSPISYAPARAAILSYNYTLELQSLSSNVTCIYDTQSPIKFGRIDETTIVALQYNGTCRDQVDILNSHNVLTFVSVNSDNGLGYWACKSPPGPQQEQSYYVYLRGRSNYTNIVGNITCTISPNHLGVLPVTFQPQANVFSAGAEISTFSTVYPELIEIPLVALGGIVHSSQNWESNLMVESVINFGIKYLALSPNERKPEYLRLYEAMIRGVLEYETAYIRLLYSIIEDPPSSCLRKVEGTADLQVIGWFAKMEHIGFLMPMTLINMTSLILIIFVLTTAKGRAYDFDPTEMRRLLAAKVVEGQQSDEWDGKVIYSSHRKSTGNMYDGLAENVPLTRAAGGSSEDVLR